MVSGNLGVLKYEQKKYNEAIPLLIGSLKIAEEINATGIAIEDLEYLSKSYEKIGNTKKGFSYYKKMILFIFSQMVMLINLEGGKERNLKQKLLKNYFYLFKVKTWKNKRLLLMIPLNIGEETLSKLMMFV